MDTHLKVAILCSIKGGGFQPTQQNNAQRENILDKIEV